MSDAATTTRPPASRRRTGTGVRLAFPVALLAFAALASAQENLADLPPFREGCQALADERFETAASRFRECWALLREAGASGPEENFVAARLLESLVRDGASAAAVSWLEATPGFQPTAATSYWIARALQTEERFAEAAEHYQVHLAAVSDAPRALVIDRAVCLARSDRPGAACDLVAGLSPESPREALRLAQIAAAGARTTEALAILPKEEETDDPEWLALRLPLARLRSSLLVDLGNRAGAVATVLRLVETSPDAEAARRAFLLLETHLEGQRPAVLAERFAAWEADTAFVGREAAVLYRHLLLDDEPARSESLRRFAAETDNAALKLEARLRLGEFDAADATVAASAPDLRERFDFARGAFSYAAGRFDEAARHFASLAGRDAGEAADRDLFNAALASLRQDDMDAFAANVSSLAERNPRTGLLADLGYLGGLSLASKGDPGAFDRLNAFVRDHPEHPAHIDARLVLAEIHLNQAPARPREAAEILEALRARPLTLAQSERLDYTSVWIEQIEGNGAELLRSAEEFVANWPSSAYLDEVLMLLASAHYTRKNLESAAAAFLRVADEFPDSPHAGTARFFATKASPPSEETVAAWRRLVDEKGPLAEEAAHELALLFLSLDRFGEARAELERLLDHLPPSAPLRYAAMADLAYSHYLEALAAGKAPEKLEEAANRFAALTSLDSAPPLWRYNAAVRRGKCLEALGKSAVALEIYRSIVEETRSGSEEAGASLPPEETEWVFRAGFAAIEILDAEENWAGAIEIADALSEKSGPRAIEAARLAERLRLKHWVWD